MERRRRREKERGRGGEEKEREEGEEKGETSYLIKPTSQTNLQTRDLLKKRDGVKFHFHMNSTE